MKPLLDIVAAGAVTAVGLDFPSACAAMRARLDGFQETRFIGPGGDWLIGAPVPMPRNFIGMKRMAHMAAATIVEVFHQVPEARGNAALILCLAEEDRPGTLTPDPSALAEAIGEIVSELPIARTRVITHGRPSGMVALKSAQQILERNEATYTLIVGVDSYLTSRSIAHYLAQERLLTPDNPNGFIPGEGAAAILCARPDGADFSLTGLGLAREQAFIYNPDDIPLRGDGMTSAYRSALGAVPMEMAELGYRISDVTGEQYFFKQTALASLRLVRGAHGFQDLWTPADSLGNVGAAMVPLMLGIARTATLKGYAAGNPVLVETSGDDGACGAAVLSKKAA